MKLILTQEVTGLGSAGDVVEVKDGYGRNFLIPKNFAVQANPRNLKTLEHDRAVIEGRAKKARKAAEGVAEKLAAVTLTIAARSGEEGKLFGAITSRDIADALEKQGVPVDRKLVQLAEPIKQLGDYKVKVRLPGGLLPEVSVSVVAEG